MFCGKQGKQSYHPFLTYYISKIKAFFCGIALYAQSSTFQRLKTLYQQSYLLFLVYGENISVHTIPLSNNLKSATLLYHWLFPFILKNV